MAFLRILQKLKIRKKGISRLFGFPGNSWRFWDTPEDSREFWGFPGILEYFLGNLQDSRVSRDFKGIPGDSEGFLGFLRIPQKLQVNKKRIFLGLLGFPEESL